MPLPITDENHHELMDVVSSLIRGCSQIFLLLEQTFFEKKVALNKPKMAYSRNLPKMAFMDDHG